MQRLRKSKNIILMLVKRTILKVQPLSLGLLGRTFSTLTSFEHPFQSRSMQVHHGDAVRHLSDPLRDPLFSPKMGSKTEKKKMKPLLNRSSGNYCPRWLIPHTSFCPWDPWGRGRRGGELRAPSRTAWKTRILGP